MSAELLLEHKEAVAQSITKGLYQQRPELLERYGEGGRAKCLQDMRYNLEHLVPALALDRPAMFADYIGWVDGLLRARNVPTDDLRASLVLMQQEAEGVLPANLHARLRACIDAGLNALEQPAGA
jgi:hypothetical protein